MTWRPAPGFVEWEPQPVSASLDAVLRSIGAPPPATMGLWVRWAELVGPQIAAHAQPLGLREGVLMVGVDQPGWATQLRFMSSALLGKLVGGGVVGIDRIEVRVLSQNVPPTEPSSTSERPVRRASAARVKAPGGLPAQRHRGVGKGRF